MSLRGLFLAVVLVIAVVAACCAQELYKMDLYVTITTKDTTICESRKTIWGGDQKTFCVGWQKTGESYCFTRDKISSEKNDITVIGIDEVTGQRYSIRLIISDEGFVIFISNLEGGFPHLVLSTVNNCKNKVDTLRGN